MKKLTSVFGFLLIVCAQAAFAQDEGRAPDAPSRAILGCEDHIRDRLGKEGWTTIDIKSAQVDEASGRKDWIVGWLQAKRANGQSDLEFSCKVDLHDGHVLSTDVQPRKAKR